MVKTNIDQLENHLDDVFGKLLQSKEVTDHSAQAMGDVGKEVVYNSILSRQTGDMLEAINSEAMRASRGATVHADSVELIAGFGDLQGENMMGSKAKRKEQNQTHMIHLSGGRTEKRHFHFEPEQDLPKWIINEFGTGPKGEDVPGFIERHINYRPRGDKPFVFPSMSMNNVGNKPATFMASGETINNVFQGQASQHEHPGVSPTRMFRDAIDEKREAVPIEIGKGIRKYLERREREG